MIPYHTVPRRDKLGAEQERTHSGFLSVAEDPNKMENCTTLIPRTDGKTYYYYEEIGHFQVADR